MKNAQLLPSEISSMKIETGTIWSRNYLINLGIKAFLQSGYRNIAWLDQGVRPEDPQEWEDKVLAGLQRSHLVQAFDCAKIGEGERIIGAVKCYEEHRESEPHCDQPCHSGLAWAARAELLEKIKLYDALPYEADPRLLYFAGGKIGPLWLKKMESLVQYQFQPCRACAGSFPAKDLRWDILTWAQKWASAAGSPSYVSAHMSARRMPADLSRKRMDILLVHNFSPVRPPTFDSGYQWDASQYHPELFSALRESVR